MACLPMITKNKAHITEQAAAQISTLWACKIENFFPPMAPGAVPTAMPAQVHFTTLIEVLMTAIEFGMDSAPEICVERRVRNLRRGLKLVVERLNTYLQLHYMLLTLFKTKVRNLLVEAISHGMDEGFHELAVQSDEFQRNHQDGAPTPGTGDVVQVPKFKRLRKLLESDDMSSLAERALGWKAAAPAPSAGGKKRKAALPSGQRRQRRRRAGTRVGSVSPRHWRAGRRGMAITAAATGTSTTTSTATSTQPALPHPPPHQVSLDSSSRLSSRSSKRSSNLNSSPSSSSSRRRPRGAGFRS